MPVYFTGGTFNGGTITSPLVITQGTITADAPQINGAVTWNNAGIVGPVWFLNVTDTSSNAAANLVTLQLGGVDRLELTKTGNLQIGLTTSPDTFLWMDGATRTHGIEYYNGSFGFLSGHASQWKFSLDNGANPMLMSSSTVGWVSSSTDVYGGTPDLKLNRDAARTHAWRDGTNANRGDIDNTWTSATVNEGFKIDWITAANICQIGVFKGSGGGTARQADWMSPDGIVALRFQMGFGTGRAPNIGTANVNTTAVGNVGGGEDVLMTYDLPLNSFIATTKRVHITAWGTTANNVNAKTLKLYFGSVILTNALTASIAGIWRVEADVISTGTDAQDYISQLVTTGTAGVALNDIENGSLVEDDGAAITIKCTGTATTDNDIVQEGMIVEFGN